MLHRRNLIGMAAALIALAAPGIQAKDFPSRNITLLVPYPAGGHTDQLAREIAGYMSKALNTSVVVDNRPGGAAQIAVSGLLKEPADGHTLLIADVPTISTNIGLFPKLSYNPRTDFQPLTQLTVAPGLFVVPANSPFKTLADLVAYAKANPQKPLNYASQGVGTGGHLFTTLFSKKLGVEMNHIPYRGSTPGLMDVVAGNVDFFYDTVPSASPFVLSGKMRALALGEGERMSILPEVPTLRELGFGDIMPTFWYGAVAKAGTPPELVAQISQIMVQAMKDPAIAQKFNTQGILTRTSNPDAFRKYTLEESDRWVKVMKAAGMKPE